MSTTFVSRQLMRARAAVLMITLIAVPLLAALGTSPGTWFALDQTAIANTNHQAAESQTSPQQAATQMQGEVGKQLDFVQPNQLDGVETVAVEIPAVVRNEDAVLRRWTQADPVPPPPSRESLSDRIVGESSQPPLQFRQIEQQLRELGATYYLLEHWSSEGPLYRFHCRMSINELKHYNQHFEAVATDPVDAMHDVLEQVRQWRDSFAQRPTT